MLINGLVKTCEACPSQWEFLTDDGRLAYARYRWGYLSVRVSEKPTDDIYDAVNGVEVYGEQISDAYDGFIEWKDVKEKIEDIEI